METHQLQDILDYTKRNPAKRYVYFIKCHDYIKVGIGYNPNDRLCQMQIGCPYPLELIHFYPCVDVRESEKELHSKYRKHWERGEWFKLPSGEIEMLKRLEAIARPPKPPKVFAPPKPKAKSASAYVRASKNRTWVIDGYWHKDALRRIVNAKQPASVRSIGRPGVCLAC